MSGRDIFQRKGRVRFPFLFQIADRITPAGDQYLVDRLTEKLGGFADSKMLGLLGRSGGSDLIESCGIRRN